MAAEWGCSTFTVALGESAKLIIIWSTVCGLAHAKFCFSAQKQIELIIFGSESFNHIESLCFYSLWSQILSSEESFQDIDLFVIDAT